MTTIIPMDLSRWSVFYVRGMERLRELLSVVATDAAHECQQIRSAVVQAGCQEEYETLCHERDCRLHIVEWQRQVHVRLMVLATYSHLEGSLKDVLEIRPGAKSGSMDLSQIKKRFAKRQVLLDGVDIAVRELDDPPAGAERSPAKRCRWRRKARGRRSCAPRSSAGLARIPTQVFEPHLQVPVIRIDHRTGERPL